MYGFYIHVKQDEDNFMITISGNYEDKSVNACSGANTQPAKVQSSK